MRALIPTAAPTAATSSGGNTRSIGWPTTTPRSTRTGADEERDLEARPEGHRHRELHLVLGRELDRDEVLGEVADRRDEDHADEELREAERLDERLDRPDEDLGEDRQQRRRAEQDDDRDAARPGRPAVALGSVRGRRGSRPDS